MNFALDIPSSRLLAAEAATLHSDRSTEHQRTVRRSRATADAVVITVYRNMHCPTMVICV